MMFSPGLEYLYKSHSLSVTIDLPLYNPTLILYLLAAKKSGHHLMFPGRNIRIITPGFEESYLTSPFHPAFLASLENFTVLRFMDWMHANSGNTPEEWEL
jgi:hypothetical protein